MKVERIQKVSKILNQIRQEAGNKNGYVTILHGSKEWDAIFFAEEFIGTMLYHMDILSDTARGLDQ